MNAVLILLELILALLGLVLIATGALALGRRLPGNGLLGVRTPETRSSPEAWIVANRAAGPGFLTAGAALVLGAAALGLIDGWIGGVVAVISLLVTVSLLNVAGLAGSRAAALWQGAQPDDEEPGCCSSGGCGDSSDSAASAPSDSGCGSSGRAASSDHGADPSADCGVSGGCGTCSLNAMCESQPST